MLGGDFKAAARHFSLAEFINNFERISSVFNIETVEFQNDAIMKLCPGCKRLIPISSEEGCPHYGEEDKSEKLVIESIFWLLNTNPIDHLLVSIHFSGGYSHSIESILRNSPFLLTPLAKAHRKWVTSVLLLFSR